MTLILSHGQPKSGSTFLFQATLLASELHNGLCQSEFREKFFPAELAIRDFVDNLAEGSAESLLAAVPSGMIYVLKTHGLLTDFIRRKIEDGTIIAFTSVRDPRDAVISMLDAGNRDRSRQLDTFFSRITELREAIVRVKNSTKRTLKWAKCHNVLVFPYYLTATRQEFAVRQLLAHVELEQYAQPVLDHFGEDKATRIIEFHKGIPDRFLTDLSPEAIAIASERLNDEIQQIDELVEKWMDYFGYRRDWAALRAKRDETFAALKAQ